MGSITPASFLAARRCKRLVREGSARYMRCDLAGAEPILREALAEAERSGRSRAVARAAQPLYYLLRRAGRHEESAAALELLVDAHRRLDGVDGRWTAEWRNELIALYGRIGCSDRLEAVCRERLESDQRRHGERSAEAAWAQLTLAWALRAAGRWAESEELCRRALLIVEAQFGCDHPRTGWALVGLAMAREEAGDPAGAEAALRRARASWARVGHADRVAAVDELLVDLYVRQRRHREALEVSSAWFSGPAPGTDERWLCRLERQAALLRAVGRNEEAGDCDERACELRGAVERRHREREHLGEGAPETPAATSCAQARLAGPIFPSPLL